MGGGSTSSKQKSDSRPLTPAERTAIYNAGITGINSGVSGMPFSQYSGIAPNTLSGGDYNALQQAIFDSSTAGLDKYSRDRSEALDADLAKRGIWSSGLAVRSQNDLAGELSGSWAKAGADAAAQRYGLQANELQATNAFRADQADKEYQSKWRPLDYLQGLWNGTGGTISSSSGGGGGWNFNI